jgi:hypothetical protein
LKDEIGHLFVVVAFIKILFLELATALMIGWNRSQQMATPSFFQQNQ